MQFIATCSKCGKLGLLTRYKTSGEQDLCRQCHADEEYKKLKEVKSGPM